MLWDADKLLNQLSLGKDSRVEFKEVVFEGSHIREPRRERLANELAAFGNTLGGALIFSVSDKGEVRPMNRDKMDALEAYISEICADSIRPPLPFVTQRLALPDGSSALIIEVERSALVHKGPGGYLSRQGSSARELAPEALRRLLQQRERSGLLGPDEEIVTGTGVNSLDEALVDRFISSRTRQADETQLAKLGLVREDDIGVLRATVAGVLLCTERPNEYISGAAIEAVRYSGDVLGRAAQHDAATITGPLDRQIHDAVNFARRNTRVAARKAPGRVDIPQFNPRAVFEAIVNAVVHRDYSLADAKIRLFLFDNRLELYSPGALPNTLPIEAMRQRQATRNEALASLLRMLEVGDVHGAGDRQYYLEQRGEGVPIIYEETVALTGNEPAFELIGGAELRVTMPSARPPVPGIQGRSCSNRARPSPRRGNGSGTVSEQDLGEGGDRHLRPRSFRLPLRIADQRVLRSAGTLCPCRAGLASTYAPVGGTANTAGGRLHGDSRKNRPSARSGGTTQPDTRHIGPHVSLRYQCRHQRRPATTCAFQAERGNATDRRAWRGIVGPIHRNDR